MQPVARTIDVYRGDNIEFVVRLWAVVSGSTIPLDVSGSEFELLVGGVGLKRTTDQTLQCTVTEQKVELRWSATPGETSKVNSGTTTRYELTRIDPIRGRRTYLNGILRGNDAPRPSTGDSALNLVVSDSDILVEVTVDDSVAPQIASALAALVAEDRTRAEAAADAADDDRAATATDRLAVSAAAAQVETSRGVVIASAAQVATDRSAVAQDRVLTQQARDVALGTDAGALFTALNDEKTIRSGLIRRIDRPGIFVAHKYGMARDITRQLADVIDGLATEVTTRKGLIDRTTRAGVAVKHKYGMQGPLAAPAIVSGVGDAFGSYSGAEIRQADAWAKLRSAENKRPVHPLITKIQPGINGWIDDGQSLAGDSNTDVGLSVTAAFNSILRLGNSSRSNRSAEGYQRFWALGDEELHVHTATNDDGTGAIYTREQMALRYKTEPLPYMQGEGGEAAIKILKQAFNRSRGSAVDLAEYLIAYGNTAQGGRFMEELSKGNYRHLYDRNISWWTQVKAAAQRGNQAAQMLLIWLNVGQSDYTPMGATLQEFYDLTWRFREDLQADIGPTDGTQLPMFIEVVASVYAYDEQYLKIAQAQRRLARDNPFIFLIGPAMAETDVGGHRNNNGRRWAASKAGQVIAEVIVERRNWHPLDVFDDMVNVRGRTLKFGVNLPVGSPIRWRDPYQTTVPVDHTQFPKRGIRLIDDAGELDFNVPEIIGEATFGTIAKRDIVGAPRWLKGDKTFNQGFTFLSDDDPFVSPDVYEYLQPIPVTYTNESGQTVTETLPLMNPGQNLPDRIGKPYPMYNMIIPGTGFATLN